jgi:murein DD-endopeptidase MepM/ murein hydrolase activator NlpD
MQTTIQTTMRSLLLALICLLLQGAGAPFAQAAPPVEENLQAFLERQPGPLKAYRVAGTPASQLLNGASAYYGVSPRILLALVEANSALLSDPDAPVESLQRPFSSAGPLGFDLQADWAARELRVGLGPYQQPPALTFTDGTTITLSLAQVPEGLAVQRLLAVGRTQPEWRAAFERFEDAFATYFDNQLLQPAAAAPATDGFLRRPWAAGTRVVHLAYFDHAYPTVDSGQRGNGMVVTYLGRGGVQYDGHDGHDYVFPDQPIGTYIYAAADGIAYASTHRGNGVWIEHENGYVTVYWHLDKFAKKFRGLVNQGAGVRVRAGDLLGSSGRSGFVQGTPHLHFEVRHHGRQVDPYGWYGAGEDPCLSYAGCAPSRWLWSPELIGEFDFTPPTTQARRPDAP